MKLSEDSSTYGLPVTLLLVVLVLADAPGIRRLWSGQPARHPRPPQNYTTAEHQTGWEPAEAVPAAAGCSSGTAAHLLLPFPIGTDWESLNLTHYFNSSFSAHEVALEYHQQLDLLLHHNSLQWLTAQARASFCKLCAARPGSRVGILLLAARRRPQQPHALYKTALSAPCAMLPRLPASNKANHDCQL